MQPFEQLEHEWAKFNDLDPAGMVACSSGTAALHLALEAFQLPQGSEVITSDFNMIAVPRAISMAGLTPVFVDCDERLLMDQQCLIDATHHSKMCAEAVVITHVYGRKFDVEEAIRFYDPEPAPPPKFVEDLAEAHGVKPHPETDAACWSFYRNKIVAGEEGGAVWFRDPKHAKLARSLRCLGFTDSHDYNHVPRGHNYRLANCLASKIRYSLVYAEQNIHQRRCIEAWYDAFCPDEWRMPKRDAVWVYDVRVPGMPAEVQNRAVAVLKDADIEARHGFKPMHRQREFNDCRLVKAEPFALSSLLASEVIYLPCDPVIVTWGSCRRAFELLRAELV